MVRLSRVFVDQHRLDNMSFPIYLTVKAILAHAAERAGAPLADPESVAVLLKAMADGIQGVQALGVRYERDRLLAAALGLELIPLGIGPHATAGLQSMITTPNGGYSWVGLFPGAYRLRALPARDSSSHLAVAVEVELPDGSADSHELHRDILLPTPRLLQGLLRTKANHPPVGIRISVSEIGLHRGTAVCDADGTFEIAQVGVGPFEFQVRANDGTPVPVETVERAHSESGTVQVAVVIP